MKYLIVFLLSLSHISLAANQESTARIDEENLEVFENKNENIRLESAKNPRNRSFPGSFRRIGGDDDNAQREEDLDDLQEFKNDPYINSEKDPRD